MYAIDEDMKEKFPTKNTEDSLVKELEYCQKLIDTIKTNQKLSNYPKVSEKLNILEEVINDDIEHMNISEDKDAKIGHKTADTSFFGYKTHIAMTEERIITAATITTGEKNDGKELESLLNKTLETGMVIDTIIGDAAYSEKGNIELTKEKAIKLVAKLNTAITQGARAKEDEFDFLQSLLPHLLRQVSACTLLKSS